MVKDKIISNFYEPIKIHLNHTQKIDETVEMLIVKHVMRPQIPQ